MLTEKPRPIRTTRSMVPEHVEDAVMRALEKLPADRFSSAKEYAEALQGRMGYSGATMARTVSSSATGGMPRILSRFRDPLVASLSLISLLLLGTLLFRSGSGEPVRAPVRFVLATPDSAKAFDNFPWPGAISPDGSVVVYSVRQGESSVLYYQRTNQLDGQMIPGTTGGTQPLFSPDGQSIAFEANGKLKKVRLDGSAPIAVADADADNGADWTTRDEFILGSERGFAGLSKVSAAGGELTEFAKPDQSKKETAFLWPIATPDGKTAFFTIWSGSLGTARLASASIDNGEINRLDVRGIRPLAVIGRTLVYLRADGVTMAVNLSRSGRELAGTPIPVLDPVPVVAGNNGNSGIFVSSGGALLTSRGGRMSQMVWASRDGSFKPVSREVRNFSTPRLSPDGQKIAMRISESDKSAVWVHDLATGTLSQLSASGTAASPVWTPDGRSVVYIGEGEKERFAVWEQNSDGGSSPKKLFELPRLTPAIALAPDGKSLLSVTYTSNNWGLFRYAFDSTGTAIPYVAGTEGGFSPQFSPDGKWVALAAAPAGSQSEVFIRSYPDPAIRVQVSAGGGGSPVWSSDGTRVYYTSAGSLLSARLALTPSLRVVARDTVISATMISLGTGNLSSNFDVSRDGRILGLLSNKNDFQLVLVPNWLPELQQRMAGAKRK
jgi:serine/threonine-protein kinase